MTERTVRVVCPDCKGDVTVGALADCNICAGYGTLSATLADPEAEALMRDGERLAHDVEAAYREGYEDACDPAWGAKHLLRLGIKAEPHEQAAVDHFWQEYEASIRQPAPETGTNVEGT